MKFTKQIILTGKNKSTVMVVIPPTLIKFYKIKKDDYITLDLKKVYRK